MHPIEFMEQVKDKNFRTQLEQDPKNTLKSVGIDPGDAEVRLVSNTANVMHIPMPPNPNGDISDETLANVAGGSHINSRAGHMQPFFTVSCPASAGFQPTP